MKVIQQPPDNGNTSSSRLFQLVPTGLQRKPVWEKFKNQTNFFWWLYSIVEAVNNAFSWKNSHKLNGLQKNKQTKKCKWCLSMQKWLQRCNHMQLWAEAKHRTQICDSCTHYRNNCNLIHHCKRVQKQTHPLWWSITVLKKKKLWCNRTPKWNAAIIYLRD